MGCASLAWRRLTSGATLAYSETIPHHGGQRTARTNHDVGLSAINLGAFDFVTKHAHCKSLICCASRRYPNTNALRGGACTVSFQRAQITGQTVGMLKVLFHTQTLEILEVRCFGGQAAEIIHIGQAIMAQPNRR